MRKEFIVFALSLTFLFPSMVFADGNRLLSQCNAAVNIMDGTAKIHDDFSFGYCMGLIRGVMDLNDYYEPALREGGKYPLFCAPDGITNAQAARIVLKFLKENPDYLHYDEVFLIGFGLREAYPCI